MANVPGLLLPTRDEEAQDPLNADLAYASGVKWLQERCRGKEFPLVEKENAEYGFRRNLRGMRRIGLTACLVAIVLSMVVILDELASALTGLSPTRSWNAITGISTTILASAAVDVFAIIGWLAITTNQWVRDAGDQYAPALLANCDSLPNPKAVPKRRSQNRSSASKI